MFGVCKHTVVMAVVALTVVFGRNQVDSRSDTGKHRTFSQDKINFLKQTLQTNDTHLRELALSLLRQNGAEAPGEGYANKGTGLLHLPPAIGKDVGDTLTIPELEQKQSNGDVEYEKGKQDAVNDNHELFQESNRQSENHSKEDHAFQFQQQVKNLQSDKMPLEQDGVSSNDEVDEEERDKESIDEMITQKVKPPVSERVKVHSDHNRTDSGESFEPTDSITENEGDKEKEDEISTEEEPLTATENTRMDQHADFTGEEHVVGASDNIQHYGKNNQNREKELQDETQSQAEEEDASNEFKKESINTDQVNKESKESAIATSTKTPRTSSVEPENIIDDKAAETTPGNNHAAKTILPVMQTKPSDTVWPLPTVPQNNGMSGKEVPQRTEHTSIIHQAENINENNKDKVYATEAVEPNSFTITDTPNSITTSVTSISTRGRTTTKEKATTKLDDIQPKDVTQPKYSSSLVFNNASQSKSGDSAAFDKAQLKSGSLTNDSATQSKLDNNSEIDNIVANPKLISTVHSGTVSPTKMYTNSKFATKESTPLLEIISTRVFRKSTRSGMGVAKREGNTLSTVADGRNDVQLKEDKSPERNTIPCSETEQGRFYDSSSLVAAAVGGAFVGALLILGLFYCRQRFNRYVRGDYRRVPLEYDFELNPRLKTT